MKKSPDPKEVGFWRYLQIEDLTPNELHWSAKGKIAKRISKTPVRWPSGVTKRIPISTIYRWLKAYKEGGLEALQPKRRKDYGEQRKTLSDQVVQEAVKILTKDPGTSFTLLLKVLEARYPEEEDIARSTLQRRLSNLPVYQRIKRLRKRTFTRFVGCGPHDIWQIDAKGPISVKLSGGKKITFHIITILDDATRAVLAAIVVKTPNLAAAVLVFRMAARRWGLPNTLYADRASIFDSHAFRRGLANMGSHRIKTKPRTPEVRGKIEAYHRVLGLWYTKRLQAQVVHGRKHLQLLLDGIIGSLYQSHYHRSIKMSPHDALANRVSSRCVPPTRLIDAFRQSKRLRTHTKTGEVVIGGITYIVPEELRGQKLEFLVDPPQEVPPIVVHPSGKQLPLKRANIVPTDLHKTSSPPRPEESWGEGPLQAIYDSWAGKERPACEPGFGLPELYELFTKLTGRHVPKSDGEAALIQRFWIDNGPFPQDATKKALRSIGGELGCKRPIKTYLEALKLCADKEKQRREDEI